MKLQITTLYFDAMILSKVRFSIRFMNKTLLTSLSDENNIEKTRIKSLEEEIKKLNNENTNLPENILTQLKIIENLSVINERNMTNTPIKDKTKQKSGFNINNYNCQIAHSTKNSKKDREGQRIFTLKPARNSLHY